MKNLALLICVTLILIGCSGNTKNISELCNSADQESKNKCHQLLTEHLDKYNLYLVLFKETHESNTDKKILTQYSQYLEGIKSCINHSVKYNSNIQKWITDQYPNLPSKLEVSACK